MGKTNLKFYMSPFKWMKQTFFLSTKTSNYISQEKSGYDYIRDNGLKRTHIIVNTFFWNIVPDFSGYKPKAPGYLSKEKPDMARLETMTKKRTHKYFFLLLSPHCLSSKVQRIEYILIKYSCLYCVAPSNSSGSS